MKLIRRGLVALSLVLAFACTRTPLQSIDKAMRPTTAPELSDDLPLEGLLKAVNGEIAFLEKSPAGADLVFGARKITKGRYLEGLRRFASLLERDRSEFFDSVRREFEFLEVYGDKGWGDVFVTSYFEPWIQGSTKPTARFSQPLYKVPADLVQLDLSLFDSKYAQDRKLRGRLEGLKVLPYYSREEIDGRSALKGKKLEICWVEPFDAFNLQVQGSGVVELEGGKKLRLNYADKNGQPYENLSRFLKDRIPPEKMSMHSIETYVKSLPREEMQKVFNLNPSYVFFRVSEESAVTYHGVEANDGRTIATDPRWFPKGALAFLSFEKPVFENPDRARPETLVPARTEVAGRFVLDQDIGGAIKGGGRLDLFWGRGDEAKLYASVVRNRGRLYYLVPRELPAN